MRYRFHAVDERGRVVREVLRAENEDEARKMLLGENLFPKRFEPVGEEEKVTWVSKKYIQSRHDENRAQSGAQTSDERVKFTEAFQTRKTEGDSVRVGRLGITEEGNVQFLPTGDEKSPVLFTSKEIEYARIRGFPARRLVLFMLNGRLVEFTAGVILAQPTAKAIVRKLRSS